MSLSRFYRHTATYTIGNLLYRGAAFILVPLNAHALPASEYGKLELITLTAFILQSVLSAGVAQSALRFYYEYDREEDRHCFISTALIGSFLFAGAGGVLLLAVAPAVSSFVFNTPVYALAFRLTAISLVIDISREINLAYIRAMERSRLFVAVALVQLCTQVGATVYFVAVLHLGIIGVLAGNLVASISIWSILTINTLRTCGVHFDWRRLKPVALYGAPLMLSGLVGAAFQSADRWTLNSYAALETIGIYALALRIVNIIPTLVVTPFTNSFGPYRFSIMKQDNARNIYARVMTYYLFVSAFVVLGLAAATPELLRLFAPPEYWPAYRLVPLLLIPAGLNGVDYCFQTGIYITKQTKYMFFATLMTGLVNVALMLLLIPRYGMIGAGLASICASLYGITQTSIISRLVYPMRYELSRMFRIVLAAGVLELLAFQIDSTNPWHSIPPKMAIIAMFPLVVGLFRVYTADEIQTVRGVWNRLCTTLQPKPAVS